MVSHCSGGFADVMRVAFSGFFAAVERRACRLTLPPSPSNRAPSQWTPHPGEAAVAYGSLPDTATRERAENRRHKSKLEKTTTKRQSAKYKPDRTRDENI